MQLGKPGIEFHTGWNEATFAYDRNLYERMTWADLLDNTDDAIAYVESQRPCGASTVVLVSHSEGTGRVLDVAVRNPRVRGLVLLGFHGHSLKDMVDYQAYQRPVAFATSDVDSDRDGIITREEAARWPKEFTYVWKDGETRISIAEYERYLRTNAELTAAITNLSKTPLYGNGIWDRAPMFPQVAALAIPVVAFNGAADVVTPPRELEGLRSACSEARKVDCETHLIPDIGHYFSPPRPPRHHPLLDETYGPVSPAFLELFTRTLTSWRLRVQPKG